MDDHRNIWYSGNATVDSRNWGHNLHRGKYVKLDLDYTVDNTWRRNLTGERLRRGPNSVPSFMRCPSVPFSTDQTIDFFQTYGSNYNNFPVGGAARFSIITGNHDETRLRRERSLDEIKVVFTSIFTLSGRPFLYYGDEIGMRYLPQVGNIEGSYWRGGSRSPMQWERGDKAGFSAADPEKFYIQLDPDPDRPCVADQERNPDSLLNFTRELIGLRHAHPALGAEGKLRRLVAEPTDSPLVYERSLDGERFLVAVNPAAKEREFELTLDGVPERVAGVGEVNIEQRNGTLHVAMSGVSAGVFQLHDLERETR